MYQSILLVKLKLHVKIISQFWSICCQSDLHEIADAKKWADSCQTPLVVLWHVITILWHYTGLQFNKLTGLFDESGNYVPLLSGNYV